MKKIFVCAVSILIFICGCCKAPEWLPPITLAPSSSIRIVIPDKCGDEVKNSAAALKKLLVDNLSVKAVICKERSYKKFQCRSVFLGNSQAANVIDLKDVQIPDDSSGIIATCGGDIFIAGFSAAEKRIENSGTAEAVRRFIAEYLTPSPAPGEIEENEARPFVSKTPVLMENLLVFLSPLEENEKKEPEQENGQKTEQKNNP